MRTPCLPLPCVLCAIAMSTGLVCLPALGSGSSKVAFDYVTLVPPAHWRESMDVHHADYHQQPKDLSQGCDLTILPARKSTGNAWDDLEAIRRRNIPGNYKQGPRELLNGESGWTVVVSSYPNRYVPSLHMVIFSATRDAVTQGWIWDLSADPACGEAFVRTTASQQMLDVRQRVNRSAKNIELTAPPALPPPRGPDGTRELEGIVCRAGITSCLFSGRVGAPCTCASPGGYAMGTIFPN